MKKNEKIFIIVLVVITIIVIIFVTNKNKNNEQQSSKQISQQTQSTEEITTQESIIGKYEQNLGNGVSLNTSNELSKTKEFDGYEIKDIQLSKNGNTTTLLATITNTTGSTKPFQMLKVTLLDENGQEIQTLNCAVKELESGESTQLSTSASSNYVNAYDFKFSK